MSIPRVAHLPVEAQALLILLCGLAVVWDLRSRRIPNWLCLCAALAGLLWNALAPEGAGWLAGLEGLGTGFALYLPLYILRARGAGDVKLLAAAGAIVGPANCFWLFLYASVAGGVVGLGLVAVKGRVGKTLFNVAWIVRELAHFRAPHKSSPELDVRATEGLRLPHAIPVALGAIALMVAEAR